jgi:hypothetical protein
LPEQGLGAEAVAEAVSQGQRTERARDPGKKFDVWRDAGRHKQMRFLAARGFSGDVIAWWRSQNRIKGLKNKPTRLYPIETGAATKSKSGRLAQRNLTDTVITLTNKPPPQPDLRLLGQRAHAKRLHQRRPGSCTAAPDAPPGCPAAPPGNRVA